MYKLELRSPPKAQDIPRIAQHIAQAMNRDPASIEQLLRKGGRIARIEDESRAQRLAYIFESAGVPLVLSYLDPTENRTIKSSQKQSPQSPRQSKQDRRGNRTGTHATLTPTKNTGRANPRPHIVGYALLSLLFTGSLAFLQRDNLLAFTTWLERSTTVALFGFALAALVLLIALLANRGQRRALGIWRTGQTFSILSFVALAASLLLPQFPQFSGVTPTEPQPVISDTQVSTEEASTPESASPSDTDATNRDNLPLIPILEPSIVSVSKINNFFGAAPYNYQATDDWDEGYFTDFRCIGKSDNEQGNDDAICYHTLKNREQIVSLKAVSSRLGQGLSEPSAVTGLATFFGSTELERVRAESATLSFGEAGKTVKVGDADATLTGGTALGENNISAYDVSASGWETWLQWYRFYTGKDSTIGN